MTTKCTWVDCNELAEHEQLGRTVEVWAHLCADHEVMLSEAIEHGPISKMMSYYVKAQGGAKVAARRTMGR